MRLSFVTEQSCNETMEVNGSLVALAGEARTQILSETECRFSSTLDS